MLCLSLCCHCHAEVIVWLSTNREHLKRSNRIRPAAVTEPESGLETICCCSQAKEKRSSWTYFETEALLEGVQAQRGSSDYDVVTGELAKDDSWDGVVNWEKVRDDSALLVSTLRPPNCSGNGEQCCGACLRHKWEETASTHVRIRDVDVRTEGGTKLLKMLKQKKKMLVRPVLIDFANKLPGGCSLGKFILPDDNFEGRKLRVHKKNSWNSEEISALRKENPSRAPGQWAEMAKRLSDMVHDASLRTADSVKIKFEALYEEARSQVHTPKKSNDVESPLPRSVPKSQRLHSIGLQTGANVLNTMINHKPLLDELVDEIVEVDRQTPFADEQARSLCSHNLNERRLEVLSDLIQVTNLAQLDVSKCGWQRVFFAEPARGSAGKRPDEETKRGMEVENRGLRMEDLLRAAAPCYTQYAKGVNHESKDLARLFSDPEEPGTWGEVHHAIRLDRLVVDCGSTHGVQALRLEQIKDAVDKLKAEYADMASSCSRGIHQ